MGLLKLPIYDGVPSASFFEPGCFAVVDETPEPEEGQPEPTERKLAIWVGDETGVPRQAGGGLDEEELTTFLLDFLPLAPSEGDGSVSFGPNERQRGNAYGTGAISIGRQGTAFGNYSVVAGKRCKTSERAAYAVAFGDDTEARRRSEFAHGVSPANNSLFHQRSWLAHGGVTRGAEPQVIRQYASANSAFIVWPGHQHSVTATIHGATPGGDRAEYLIEFTAARARGGDLIIDESSIRKTVLHEDVPEWEVHPVTQGVFPVQDEQTIDFEGSGREGDQIRWSVYIEQQETTLPGPPPPMPVVTSDEASGGTVEFEFDPPDEVEHFQGYTHRLIVLRGTSLDSLQRYDDESPGTQSWSGGTVPDEGGNFYYAFVNANLHGIWSPQTEVFGPY